MSGFDKKTRIDKIYEQQYEFRGFPYCGPETEDIGEKIRWMSERLSKSVMCNFEANLSLKAILHGDGEYRVRMIIERVEEIE